MMFTDSRLEEVYINGPSSSRMLYDIALKSPGAKEQTSAISARHSLTPSAGFISSFGSDFVDAVVVSLFLLSLECLYSFLYAAVDSPGVY